MQINDTSLQPRIVSIQTAVPPHRVAQTDVRDFVYALFHEEYQGLERLLPVYESTNIATRHFSMPLQWFGETHSFATTTKMYVATALQLLTEVSENAIIHAGIDRADIAQVVVVSTTGIATPSLDAKLIQSLGLPQHTKRLPVWGLGCAGGVSGLARASELTRLLPRGKYTLFVAVELCSLTFQRNDISKSNIVGTSLFADGAAAVLLENAPAETIPKAQILDSYSHLFDDSEDIMGWDVIETGLKVRFSENIPVLVRTSLPALFEAACASWNVDTAAIKHVVVHAGGAKVLKAYEESLKIAPERLQAAYHILHNFGNMSSASVLFTLESFLAGTPPSNDLGVMIALGPGFSAEFVLFRW
jgi:alkylresorcinol/alkylpyrone synthase